MNDAVNSPADPAAPSGAIVSISSSDKAPTTACRWGDALGFWPQTALFILVLAAIVSRRPGLFAHPQFYAEDGRIWYAQAYNLGAWRALLVPYSGYISLFPRLVAALSLLAPLRHAPLVMVAFGALFQALPVTLLLSSRCASLGGLKMRAAMALAYIALPNSQEAHVVLTSAQWHLALLALLVVLACPPQNWLWRTFDLIILTLGGLTGPFAVMLVPVAFAVAWKRRGAWSVGLAGALAVCAMAEAAALLWPGGPGRSSLANLGATGPLFLRIVSGQIFMAAVAGSNDFGFHAGGLAVGAIFFFGVLLVLYSFAGARFELRLILFFCALMLCAGLASPLGAEGKQWEGLLRNAGCRYWFFPLLGFLWALLELARRRAPKWTGGVAAALLVVAMAGAARDWTYFAFPDIDFPSAVQRFDAAAPGSKVSILIIPAGWTMTLVKR